MQRGNASFQTRYVSRGRFCKVSLEASCKKGMTIFQRLERSPLSVYIYGIFATVTRP